ncbi:sensor histidine kinase [Amnibacterium kyonggiense]
MTERTGTARPAWAVPFGAADPTGSRTWVVLLIIAVIGFGALQTPQATRSPAALALTAAALLAWAGYTVLRRGRARGVLIAVCAAAAAVGTGLGVTVLVAGMIAPATVLLGDPRVRLGRIVALCAGSAAVLLVVAVPARLSPTAILIDLGGLAFGIVIGVSRRYRVRAVQQQEALREAAAAAEQDAARNRLLEERAAVARDIHDVLAHSLGGLVLQLDAIEALLERGRADEAAVRASSARSMAAEGLAEARRAVAALRDPCTEGAVDVPDEALADLIAAHRSLGGAVDLTGDPTLAGVDRPHRQALVRSVQEALTNARRHAPGLQVRVRVVRSEHALRLQVENALPASPAPSPGGGHGLLGMRERFAALGDGSSASAGVEGGSFVVEATAVLP